MAHAMKRVLPACVALGIATLPALGAQFKFTNQTLSVPDGFEVELVAGPPLVNRPIEADFDEQGGLYVTDSSGSNDKTDKQLQDKPHRVVRLEDTDGDGRYDKTIVFADKMMFPEGAMWYAGSLYVAAPPSIWKLTDTDGDGVADKREEWFQGKTLTGCANDLHGPYLGLDGWIYWCKGAFAKQTYERPGKAPFVTRASHIFRCRPDGSGIEPVMTGGMDNPVGLAFTPSGERIFSTTFLQQPAGGKRDGLIHAIYGGVYGKQHDVIEEHKRTGDLMPVLTHLGPAAPCGLARYQSAAFGKEYTDNLFTCLFNLHKVTRHVLVAEGATFRTQDSDFVTSDSNDFHPTDVLEDADGSLLVLDTGGWYKLCCPTSQLYKPDLLGAIYRVRKKGASKVTDPRGLKIQWREAAPDALAKLLADPRPAVRARAIQEVANRGEASVRALAGLLRGNETASVARLGAVWALTRIDAPPARAAIRSELKNHDDSVRAAAIHSISVWRDKDAVDQLTAVVAQDSSAHAKRAAAEALGRIGAPVTSTLLSEATRENDRALDHSLLYALIEIADVDGTKAGLAADNPRTRRAALIALDQMDGGGVPAKTIAAATFGSSHELVRQTAEWIAGRHPEWAEEMVPFFKAALQSPSPKQNESEQVQRLLKSYASQAPIQGMLGEMVSDETVSKPSRLLALKTMADSRLKEMPAEWCAKIVGVLNSSDSKLAAQAVATMRAFPASKDEALNAALSKLARESANPAQLRLDALAALPAGQKLDDALFGFVCEHVEPSKPVSVRGAATTVLSKAKLALGQLLTLAEKLKGTGPLEIPKLLSAFAKSTNEDVGIRLVASLNALHAVSPFPAQWDPKLGIHVT